MPHTHDHLCLTVETFIVHKGRVLLRMHDKHRIWLSIGGHIEPGEDPIEAALREVKEEVGLTVTLVGTVPVTEHHDRQFRNLLVPRFIHRNLVTDSREHVTFVYFATSTTDSVKPSYADDQSDMWRWFSREEIDNPNYHIRDNIKFYAKAALDAVGNGA